MEWEQGFALTPIEDPPCEYPDDVLDSTRFEGLISDISNDIDQHPAVEHGVVLTFVRHSLTSDVYPAPLSEDVPYA